MTEPPTTTAGTPSTARAPSLAAITSVTISQFSWIGWVWLAVAVVVLGLTLSPVLATRRALEPASSNRSTSPMAGGSREPRG